MTRLHLPTEPAFSFAAAAAFAQGFSGTRSGGTDASLTFAWALDGDWRTVAVAITAEDGGLRVETDAGEEAGASIRRDLEAILCLDVDGSGFAAVGERDPVIGAVQRRWNGLRPVLFYTPYEAAAWSIISQRIRRTQAGAIRQRIAAEHGEHGAFPAPERLAALPAGTRGLTPRKVDQLRALGAAAATGALDRAHLRTLDEQQALAELQELPGIGPFGAELVLIRGVGAPDALPRFEQRVAAAVRERYGLAADADITPIAEAWRPYRSWVATLLRVDAAA